MNCNCLGPALDYLAQGFSVLRLCPPDHVGVGKEHGAACGSPGKAPTIRWTEYQERLPTAAEVEGWWRAFPTANLGLALGPVSGLVGVDADGAGGRARVAEMAAGDLPPTLEFVTPGGGYRWLYAIPAGSAPLRTTHTRGLQAHEGVSLLAKGSQTVLPPSRHPSGGVYAWAAGRAPGQIEAAPAPAWLLDLLRKDRPAERPERFAEGEVIPDGYRDNALTSMAGAMRKHGFCRDAILAALEVENTRCDPPKGAADLERIAGSVARYEPDPLANVTIKLGKRPAAEEEEADGDATAADLIRVNATVRWVWEGWIPLGVLTILASEPGVGKTRLCADLLRRIYLGLPWPDGQPASLPVGSTALWIAADNQHPELGSIPGAFGFPPEALYLNASKANPFGGTMLDEKEDLDAFERRIARVRPAIVFIDTSLNATDRSSHKPEDAKAFFVPLQQIAARQQLALVCVTHLNAAGKPLGRRITGQGRVVVQMEKPDPEGQPNRRKLWVTKSNSIYPPALGVTMGDGGNEYDKNPPTPPAETDPVGPRRVSSTERCMDWLVKHLSGGPQLLGNTRKEAEENKFSSKTFYAAKATLKCREYSSEGLVWIELAE